MPWNPLKEMSKSSKGMYAKFIFWRRSHPVCRGFYAVLHGTFKGTFITVMGKTASSVTLMTLPDKGILTVPMHDFKTAMQGGVIEFIKKLPKRVFKVVENEFLNLNNKNGLRRTKKNN
jgi:hypothetical protein